MVYVYKYRMKKSIRLQATHQMNTRRLHTTQHPNSTYTKGPHEKLAMEYNYSKTRDTAFEALWDLVIIFLMLRTAVIYFVLTLATGVISYCAVIYLPAYPKVRPMTEYTEMEIVAAHIVLMTGIVVRAMTSWCFPRSSTFRLAAGAAALGMLVFAESVVSLGLYGEGYGVWNVEMSEPARDTIRAAFVMYALLPTALMIYDKEPEDELRPTPEERWLTNGI